jgi:putative transposase
MEELDRYPWSGHRMVIGKEECPWMDREYLLAQFSSKNRKAVRAYRRFVQDGLREGHKPDFTGGGLIRSQGRWSQVLALRSKGEKEAFDDRILGGGEFVDQVLREAEEGQLRQMRLRRRGRSIGDIIQEECGKENVSEQELRQGSRRRLVSKVRAAVAQRSKEELGVCGAEIARNLGVNTSSINRALAKWDEAGSK